MDLHINGIHSEIETHLIAPTLPPNVAEAVVAELGGRYREPWRHYHTIEHLADMLTFLVENTESLRNPRTTFWAAFGHDSVYVPQLSLVGAGVNEKLSAQLTEARLRPYLPLSELNGIGRHIRATADHIADHADDDLAYLLDADLKVLGAPPEVFDEYDENIRREYSFVDSGLYAQKRVEILRTFHAMPQLFITDVGHTQFEERAKANLDRKIVEYESSAA